MNLNYQQPTAAEHKIIKETGRQRERKRRKKERGRKQRIERE